MDNRMLILLILGITAGKFFKVNPETQFFVDSKGFTRIFHGVDILYKVPPYYPDTEKWSADDSLTERDIKDLKAWGMNVVRLSIMWTAIFPNKSGEIDQQYIDKVKEIVESLGKHGIYTILNLHQDLLSNYFCGEGMPDYLVKPYIKKNTFPFPVQQSINRDAKGHPLIEECRSRVPIFGIYYFAEEVSKVMKQVYVGTGPENTNSQINQDLNSLWAQVAKEFKDNENVLGLELFNEPFAADLFSEPWGIIPTGYTGSKYLTPLYRQLHETIRKIDNEHIIFFNPSPLDQLSSGLSSGPGGAAYNDRQAFSYHIYCFILKPSGEPVSNWVCKWMDALLMYLRMREFKQLKCGGLLTEFGALDETDGSIAELNVMTGLADQNMQGWVYSMFKQYKDITTQNHGDTEGFYYLNGTLQIKKVKALTRTYAPLIAGEPTYFKYDPDTRIFEISYKIVTNIQAQGYTEIFLHKEYHYKGGYSYQISPGNLIITEPVKNYLKFQHPPGLMPGSHRFQLGNRLRIDIRI